MIYRNLINHTWGTIMKKRILITLLIAALMCTLLPACGAKEQAAEDEDFAYSDVELSKIIDFTNATGVSVRYPDFMEVETVPNTDNTYIFYPADQSGSNAYASIMVSLVEIPGFDDYMSKGSDLAEKANTYILANMLQNTYGNAISEYVGTSFEDGGSYWSLTGFLKLDGSQFTPSTADLLTSTAEIRYVGPTGYAVYVLAMALDEDITEYYNIGRDMVGSVTLGGTWSTAPKKAPSFDQIPEEKKITPKKARTTTKKNKKRNDNASPLADPFYWYDDDGDLWYFDGYDSIFIGFSDDYYLEDGELMESNDAGWDFDDDYYDPWDDTDYGDYVDEDDWGDYVDEDDWGDYVDEDDWGDYVDEDDYGDYVDDYDDYSYDDYSYDDGGYDDYSYDDYGDDW